MRRQLFFLAFMCLLVSSWARKDYYKILNVPKTASEKDIRKSYYKLARQWHPDKNQGNEEASLRYVEINEAYDTLSDAEKKRKYDLGDDPFANAAFRWGQGDSKRLFSETIDITSANWGHYIDRAEPGEIWLILFYRDGADRASLIAAWDEAYSRLKGIVRMGRVNVESDRYLAMQMRIRYEPSIASYVAGPGQWRFHSGPSITTDSIVAIASELYHSTRLRPLDSRYDWDSIISPNFVDASGSGWKQKVVIVSDTSRVILKYRHLAEVLDNRAEVYYITTWTQSWVTKAAQQLLGSAAASLSAPFVLIVDDTAGQRQERFKHVPVGTKSWRELQTEIRSLLLPLLPVLSLDNYMDICQPDLICILLSSTKRVPLDSLRQLAAHSRIRSRELFSNDGASPVTLQFAWLDTRATPSLAEAFGKSSSEDKESLPFVILFDRSRFEFHQMSQKEADSLYNEHLAGGKLEVATSLVAKYFKNRSKYRFERLHSVPMFITPTLWMRITSWKAIVSYLGFIGVIYAVMRLIKRLGKNPAAASDAKKKPKKEEEEEEPNSETGAKKKAQQQEKRQPQSDSERAAGSNSSSTSSSGTDASSSSESATENYNESEDASSKPPKRQNEKQKPKPAQSSSSSSESDGDESEGEESRSGSASSDEEEEESEQERSDDDSNDSVSLRKLVQEKGWLDMTKTKISSLKHPLVFIYFSKADSVSSEDLAALAECGNSFAKDPLHFGVHIGDSRLRSFVRENCNTDDSAQLGGLALHARRGKYILFYGNVSSLKEWISKLLEGSLRFSQLSSDLTWPNVDSHHASS
eukprot:TRINITY_DN4106_c0_g1_i1.p1 TRINITY_DN4106_c0_g1~~TRINITY_DN4106_c0_g1_i1.p1  ORF type:complete len:810 (-),score=159.25 TRINITY_DN4106_c0_g1_i1:2711-5140(-)